MAGIHYGSQDTTGAIYRCRKPKDVRVLNAGQRHLNLRSFRNTKPKGRLPPSAQVPEA